jgi:hypothetical protein
MEVDFVSVKAQAIHKDQQGLKPARMDSFQST